MFPWGLIALHNERMMMSLAKQEIEKRPELRIVAGHVDQWYVLRPYDGSRLVDEVIEACRFKSGEPMLQVKSVRIETVPTWPQKQHKNQVLKFVKQRLVPILEQELGENLALSIAQKIAEHRGLLLTGPAGVGKTWLIHEILRLLKETSPDQKQIIAALRHCAAMLVGGKTVQHYLCKYRKHGGAPKAGTYVVIDECSEIQLHTWSLLAQWKLMGVHFIILGDFDGQLPPIFDKWANAMETLDIRTSQLLYDLVGGLHIKLTVYRRGTDAELFRRYVMLYQYAHLKPARLKGKFNDDYHLTQQIIERARETYPMHDGVIDKIFCRKHKQRIGINALVNKIEAAKRDDVLLLECKGRIQGAHMQPQDMYIWVGMELLCYSRKYRQKYPVNGGVYVVETFDATHVVVRLHEDYRKYLDGKKAEKELKELVEENSDAESEASDAESDPEDMGADEDDDEECTPPP